MEKSPTDLVRMRLLASVFKPAWFAVILRHPLSVCRRVTPPPARLACAQNWLVGYETAARDAAAARLRTHTVFYEKWAQQPVLEMERLARSAALPFAPANASGDGFRWSDVLEVGGAVGLAEHAARGWGYAGPLNEHGLPDVSGRPIVVDASRLLPEAAQDVRREAAALWAGLEALEGRLNAFGYTFYEPFVTGCEEEMRAAAACPPAQRAG